MQEKKKDSRKKCRSVQRSKEWDTNASAAKKNNVIFHFRLLFPDFLLLYDFFLSLFASHSSFSLSHKYMLSVQKEKKALLQFIVLTAISYTVILLPINVAEREKYPLISLVYRI